MPSPTSAPRNIAIAAIWFALSTIITWYFIYCGASLYHFDQHKMLLSCSIAGAKWSLQIFCAILFLKDKRWPFIRRIGFTCFAGSCVLLPFCAPIIRNGMSGNSFLISLILAVALMLFLYYRSVRNTGVNIGWYFFWVACLVTAISLQLTVVFHII